MLRLRRRKALSTGAAECVTGGGNARCPAAEPRMARIAARRPTPGLTTSLVSPGNTARGIGWQCLLTRGSPYPRAQDMDDERADAAAPRWLRTRS
jgi:hypothetical protein